MRTLSARILLGFTALTVAFGVITATVVVNMQKVEDQILIVSAAYVPLALTSKDLALHQRDLKAFVDEGFEDAPGLTRARHHRDQSLTRTLQILDQRDEPVTADISDFHDKILHMQTEVSNITPVYENLIQKLHAHVNLSNDTTIGQLRNAETQLEHEASELTRSLEERVKRTASELRSREHTLRLGTIYLGLTAIVARPLDHDVGRDHAAAAAPAARSPPARSRPATTRAGSRSTGRPRSPIWRASSTRWRARSRSASASWCAPSGSPRSARSPR